MSFLKNILADLREKPLLGGLALILVALLVGVPMTLAKPGEPTAVATVPAPHSDDDTGPELALTRASTTGFARPPRVNDKRLDPFGVRGEAPASKDVKTLQNAIEDVISAAVDGGGGGGGGVTPVVTDPGPSDPPADDPAPTTPKVEYEQDDLLTILITSGTEEPKEITDIRTLSPLPDADNPFLVYVGKASGDNASFLVSADVSVTGDGTCTPTPQDCRTLTMGIGDTNDFRILTGENAGKTISVTVTDMETKKVPITGDDATEEAAQLESETRAVGAKAVKSVLKDPDVVESLIAQKVKIRH